MKIYIDGELHRIPYITYAFMKKSPGTLTKAQYKKAQKKARRKERRAK